MSRNRRCDSWLLSSAILVFSNQDFGSPTRISLYFTLLDGHNFMSTVGKFWLPPYIYQGKILHSFYFDCARPENLHLGLNIIIGICWLSGCSVLRSTKSNISSLSTWCTRLLHFYLQQCTTLFISICTNFITVIWGNFGHLFWTWMIFIAKTTKRYRPHI